MDEKSILGRHFEFNNEFFKEPKKYGIVNLLQMGELCCERGFEIEPHMQICHEISCILSGEGCFMVNGRRYPVHEGDLFINQKGEMHAIQSSSQAQLWYLYMGFEFNGSEEGKFRSIMDFFRNPLVTRIARDKLDVTAHFLKLLNEFYTATEYSPDMRAFYILQILILTYRSFKLPFSKRPPFDQRVNVVGGTVYGVVKYIDNNLMDIDNVRCISSNLGYSYSYLSHLFKNKTGMTLQNYVIYKKIEKSLELIDEARLSITQIASELHYDTLQSFSKAFKRTLGFSPANYQKRCSAENI